MTTPQNKTIAFTVPGEPTAKGRARSTKSGRHYTPDKTARYENLVKIIASQAMSDAFPFTVSGVDEFSHKNDIERLFTGAVILTFRAFFSVPESWSAKKKKSCLLGEIYPTKKPDIDNIEKALLDGMNGVVWRDDVQVVDVIKSKRFGSPARVEVEVTAL
ncbi:RusA family crossover junction endodeoxyribonuclease [Candidatus Methylospira mobilis]|uniref:RusA family crossover junction endodeoxyribonuclease n=1 Tax=Candidatus Methylospira mobilis TaxID=1808979 RepID=A0A5Q0BHE2_9GAMM|nr:RusA family crossover junction endodeoxyribonuclease [Candidatus Methylospira mobilis]QFY42969.1 RusA family crossover junction endodeoxyribonuclease [Candidatus Methylospira mobilis]